MRVLYSNTSPIIVRMTKSFIKIFIPKQILEWRRKALLFDQFRYAQDGLYTVHQPSFKSDKDFERAYAKGKATGSWGNYEIHWRLHTVLWAAKQVKDLPGDFVECGVNRGGLSRAILEYIDLSKPLRKFYLLDTFEGFDPKVLTEVEKKRLNRFSNYENTYEEVKGTFSSFPNVKIIKGTVPNTLNQVDTERVSYLSIDMNCVGPEIAALDFFWPKMVKGGIIVLDDYCYDNFAEQNQAHAQWAANNGANILTIPTGQGVIIKL